MIKRLIGYLMFLANGEGLREQWYPLKQKLCDRYGVNNGYDIQYIEGKRCFSCEGTGVYAKFTHYTGIKRELCYRCDNGWYKKPCYVLLERIKVGNYAFHKPIKSYSSIKNVVLMDIPLTVTINGYISHNKKKYGWLAFSVLYILYDFKGYRKYVKTLGLGWKVSWWLPKNWLYNIMHIRNKGFEAYPFRSIKMKFAKQKENGIDDFLPF